MDDQIPKEVSLEHLFPPERLSEQLRGFHEWQPFPKPTQRAFWDHLPADVQQELLAAGIETRNAPWPALPAGLYLNYVRYGDRSKFESAYFKRREILTKMVLAECSQYQGYFLDSIADAVWGICEESTWCVPAHVSVQLQGEGLPDTGEPIVDLFAAETGALLAWVLFLLEDELESISPMVPMRIEREIQQRILIPAATRDDFWWMGFSDRKVNNWNPWINSNWLACVLLVEKIPETRSRTVSKILHSLDQFFIPYPQDGGCDEGPSYWGRAGASLFDCLNLLDSALVGGAAEVFELPKVKEIGRFIYRSHIAGEYYLNFADAPAVLQPDPATVYGYGKGSTILSWLPSGHGRRAIRVFSSRFLASAISRERSSPYFIWRKWSLPRSKNLY